MNEKIGWSTHIEFEGGVEELEELAASLNKLVANRKDIKFVDDGIAGGNRLLERFISPAQMARITEGMPRLVSKRIEGIRGGMSGPHVHDNGALVLLKPDRFVEYMATVAAEIARVHFAEGGFRRSMERMNSFLGEG